MNTVETKKSLDTMSVREFAQMKNFTQVVPTTRVNKKGYPYLTFINDKNEAENVYFSKAAAVGLSAGMPVDLKQYQVAETENAEGESRFKLISNSSRVNLADIL